MLGSNPVSISVGNLGRVDSPESVVQTPTAELGVLVKPCSLMVTLLVKSASRTAISKAVRLKVCKGNSNLATSRRLSSIVFIKRVLRLMSMRVLSFVDGVEDRQRFPLGIQGGGPQSGGPLVLRDHDGEMIGLPP